MNGMEMVVAIVGISAVASVIRAKYGYRSRRGLRNELARGFIPGHDDDQSLVTENRQLRDEMHGLKERIQVLERLATDDESDARRLDREIEKLRERPGAAVDKTNRE